MSLDEGGEGEFARRIATCCKLFHKLTIRQPIGGPDVKRNLDVPEHLAQLADRHGVASSLLRFLNRDVM